MRKILISPCLWINVITRRIQNEMKEPLIALRGPSFFSQFLYRAGSEEILQRELHDARVKRGNHLAERGIVEVRCRVVLPEAVREIECLCAELYSLRFLESEISRERDV